VVPGALSGCYIQFPLGDTGGAASVTNPASKFQRLPEPGPPRIRRIVNRYLSTAFAFRARRRAACSSVGGLHCENSNLSKRRAFACEMQGQSLGKPRKNSFGWTQVVPTGLLRSAKLHATRFLPTGSIQSARPPTPPPSPAPLPTSNSSPPSVHFLVVLPHRHPPRVSWQLASTHNGALGRRSRTAVSFHTMRRHRHGPFTPCTFHQHHAARRRPQPSQWRAHDTTPHTAANPGLADPGPEPESRRGLLRHPHSRRGRHALNAGLRGDARRRHPRRYRATGARSTLPVPIQCRSECTYSIGVPRAACDAPRSNARGARIRIYTRPDPRPQKLRCARRRVRRDHRPVAAALLRGAH
jgi:hypothetical protein